MNVARIARLVRPAIVGAMAILALALALPSTAQQKSPAPYDHLRTRFPLTGVHAVTPCESCHIGGQMSGTPTQCDYCHRAGSRIAVTVKPARHVQTAESCDVCHRSSATWTGARFSHVAITPGTCFSCHNGSVANGKPGGHVVTSASCDTCHRTGAWLPASFNHASVTPGLCALCHGSTATGKPAAHIATTASCDQCHRTSAWLPATFSHANVVPGTCASCHGITATGKPATHVVTTASCDQCHKTAAWLPATFNHVGVVPGSCATCHRVGGSGLAKPTNHIPYETQLLAGASLGCDSCHTSTVSFTIERMNHNNTPGNGAGWCRGCHVTGTTYLGTMAKRAVTHQSKTAVDCSQSGCHRPLGTQGTTYKSW
jgi:glutaredoxin